MPLQGRVGSKHVGYCVLVATDTVLEVTNIILAVTALITAGTAIAAVLSSMQVTDAAKEQADATATLATATADLAKNADDQLRLAREALEASIRPAITYVPQDPSHPDSDLGPERQVKAGLALPGIVFFSVPIRNVGPGPAFIQRAYLEGKGGKTDAYLKHLVLPSGEITQIYGSARPGDSDLLAVAAVVENNFKVGVRYTDVNGGQRTQTVIGVARVDWSRRGHTHIYYQPMSEVTHHCGDDWKPVGAPSSKVGPDVPLSSEQDEEPVDSVDQQMSSIEAALNNLIKDSDRRWVKLKASLEARSRSFAESNEHWKKLFPNIGTK
jgi:hypothetical protein